MTAVVDPRRMALTALAVAGDLARVTVTFVERGGVLMSVHERDVPFMSRLLDLTGLAVSDAGEPRPARDGEVVSFERTQHAYVRGGLSVEWYCEDAELVLADLADYRRAIEEDLASGGVA